MVEASLDSMETKLFVIFYVSIIQYSLHSVTLHAKFSSILLWHKQLYKHLPQRL